MARSCLCWNSEGGENTGPSSAQWSWRGALFGRQVAGNALISPLRKAGGGGVETIKPLSPFTPGGAVMGADVAVTARPRRELLRRVPEGLA